MIFKKTILLILKLQLMLVELLYLANKFDYKSKSKRYNEVGRTTISSK
ncbi:MAG: hypothetical protein ACTSRZ_15360 [Promethearchaeota archaeon]